MKARLVLSGLIAAVAFIVVPITLATSGDTSNQAFPVTAGQAGKLFPLRSSARIGSTPWAGKWRSTNFGVMTLTQTGSVVRGSYTYKGGRVSGTASGRMLRGTWTQLPTRRPPNNEGQFVFTLAANGKSWTSKWRYDSSGAWRTNWSGTRISTG
jgi:alkaline phosphatase D